MTFSNRFGHWAALLLAGLLAAGAASAVSEQVACEDEDLVLYCARLDENGDLVTSDWSQCGDLVPSRQPVLFVHGHGDFGVLADVISECKEDEHKCNWLLEHKWKKKNLPSFGDALVEDWARLGIEPYFIQIDEQNQAIEIDSCLIERAVNKILERHDDPTAEAVKLVLVGYSKGSISSRLYLKHLHEARGPSRPFAPVSEFVAISPPNHGLVYKQTLVIDTKITTSLALRQLNNGYDEGCDRLCCDEDTCLPSSSASCLKKSRLPPPVLIPNYSDCQSNDLCKEDASLGFIGRLNSNGETPGGRPAHFARNEGVLFLSLYDPHDAVGGSGTYGNSCTKGQLNGRLLAKNLGPDAENREVRVPPHPASGYMDSLVVHGNAPHTPEVICETLYTAAHRHLPPDDACQIATSNADYEKLRSITLDHPGVVLLLDVSGSMSSTPEGKTPDQELNGRSKLSMVQAAAKYFLDELSAWNENRSHFALATFPARSQGPQTPCSGQGRIPMSLVTKGSVENADAAIDDLITAGNTPLLAALDKALGMFGGENKKAIILLTDGFQNCPEQAVPDETIEHLKSSGVVVYTIGFGRPFETDSPLLIELAQKTGKLENFHDITQDLEPEDITEWDHESALKSIFKDIISKDLELEVAVDPLGTIGHGGQFSRQIWLNEHDRRVSFGLSWITPSAEGERRLRLRVFSSDRGEVTSAQPGVRVYAGPKHEIVTIDETFLRLPGKVGDKPWRLEIDAPGLGPKETESYQYDVLLDSELKMSVGFDQPAYAAGDEVTLTAELTVGGQPLTGAQVTAEVHRPEDGLGNWFAAHAVTEDELDQVPEERDDEFLPRFLRKAIFLSELRPTPLPGRLSLESKTLHDEGRDGDRVAGDGVYTVRFRDTPREGTYLFQVRATSSASAGGPRFHRERSVQRYFTVRPASEATSVNVEEIPLSEKGPRRFRIWVSPRDRLGNYLGPRFGQSIHMDATQGFFVDDTVEDHLDGRYSLDLELLEDQDPGDTRISVDAGGARQSFVLAEKLSEWFVSFHLGLAMPHGRLGRDFDDGLAVGLDLERSLRGRLSAVGLLEYHAFRSAVAGVGDTHWWNLSANLEYRGRARPISWYAAGGIGGYVPRNGSVKPGANLELGFQYSWRGRWSLDFGAGYHRVFTSGSDDEFLVPKLRWIYQL